MSKVPVQTQAKTPAAVAPASQPPVAVPERETERPDVATQMESAARLGHSLEAIRVDGSAPPIVQRQELPEEEEEELQMQRKPDTLQRQELPDEEEEELQLKREPDTLQRQELPEEEEEELQMKPDGSRVGPEGGPVPLDVESAVRRARGSGQPLDDTLQAQMGQAMGHDFSNVRVHTDTEADALNQQLGAKAFATGQDIFFKRDAYEPGSASGRELLAHELTHVVQQNTGQVGGSGSGILVRPASDVFEQKADDWGHQAASVNHQVGAQSAETAVTQRQSDIGIIQRTKMEDLPPAPDAEGVTEKCHNFVFRWLAHEKRVTGDPTLQSNSDLETKFGISPQDDPVRKNERWNVNAGDIIAFWEAANHTLQHTMIAETSDTWVGANNLGAFGQALGRRRIGRTITGKRMRAEKAGPDNFGWMGPHNLWFTPSGGQLLVTHHAPPPKLTA